MATSKKIQEKIDQIKTENESALVALEKLKQHYQDKEK